VFPGQTLADALDALYDLLVTEKGMTKAAADGMRVDELAALLRHETEPAGASDDAHLAVTESPLSAADPARLVGATRHTVNAFLRRYREHYPDCAVEVEARRRNEPRYLYRATDVLPALRAHLSRVS
jgi:hypothetical protein